MGLYQSLRRWRTLIAHSHVRVPPLAWHSFTPIELNTGRHANVPNSAPTPAVSPIASAPQNVTRMAPVVTGAPPTRAATPPRIARNTSEIPETTEDQARRRDNGGRQQRHGRANGEAGRGGKRSLNRPRPERLGDAEFVAGMRAQRVMGHQLLGNLFRERGIQTAVHIDRRKFLVLGLVVCLDLRAFHAERGLFGIRL